MAPKLEPKVEPRRNAVRTEHYTYVPERVLGSGAFGCVYQCQVAETNQIVCIKQVSQDQVEKCPDGFPNEISTLLELNKYNHANVMHLYDAFWGEGLVKRPDGSISLSCCLYFVAEYFPDNLMRVLRHSRLHKTPLTPLQQVLYAYQLFRSIFYLHSLNFIHFDVKPQNILLNGVDNRLALCDFGTTVRQYYGASNPSPYVQSRYYRSPETILGCDRLTGAVDVWSAACVVCELVLGHPIFHGAGPDERGIKKPQHESDSSNYEMFKEIQKILGTPTEKEIEAMNHNFKIKDERKRMERHPMRKLFGQNKVYYPGLDELCDFALQYSPMTRPRAENILAHDVFSRSIFGYDNHLLLASKEPWPPAIYAPFTPPEWNRLTNKLKKELHPIQFLDEQRAETERRKNPPKVIIPTPAVTPRTPKVEEVKREDAPVKTQASPDAPAPERPVKTEDVPLKTQKTPDTRPVKTEDVPLKASVKSESSMSGETEDEVPTTKPDKISPKIESVKTERRSPERKRSPDALLPGKAERKSLERIRNPDAVLPGQPERRSPERRRSPDAVLPGQPERRSPERRRSPDAILPGQPERSPDAILPGQPERKDPPPKHPAAPPKHAADPPRKAQSILPGVEVSAPEDDRSAKKARLNEAIE